MAEVHNTTMVPTKIELLTDWIPRQSWYVGEGTPSLARAGGFRLDDPDGEVGIEVMVVSDAGDGVPVYYLVPMTYHAAERDDARESLIGTSQHGVLGLRWIYDGVTDPVLLGQVGALLRGEVLAQAQHESHALDATSTIRPGTGDSPHLLRVLAPSAEAPAAGAVMTTWRSPDGTELRGVLATLL